MSNGKLVSKCDVNIVITETLKAPVYFYYGLSNFYQNHRKYLKSRDADQLAGVIKAADSITDCDPIIYNKDIAPYLTSYFNSSIVLDPNAVANPCGLVAKSYFTGINNLEAL